MSQKYTKEETRIINRFLWGINRWLTYISMVVDLVAFIATGHYFPLFFACLMLVGFWFSAWAHKVCSDPSPA